MNEEIKISVIISVYKDIEALNLILRSLYNQTYNIFEIIVSEDCKTSEMLSFLKKHKNVKHTSQEDISWRKNIALNNAIRKSSGNYLIFLDGDIVPYKNFIENHFLLTEKNRFLSGRRVELGPFFSKLIRKDILSFEIVQKLYLLFFPFLILDKARHVEEGIYLKAHSYLEKKINSNKKKNMMLVGCNFSCWKKDLELINGFDEDYKSPSVGEDVDLSWRFNHFGIRYKSVRYIANTFHLFHERNWGDSFDENNKIMDEKIKNKIYKCKNGLIKEKT